MIALVEQPFDCIHCGKSFMKEKTLIAHMCENKRRFLQRDEKRVQTGFYAYTKFYQTTQNSKKQKTYEDFCKSAYYNAFVKFGSYINNINPLYPEKYIDYVIKSGVKLDHWCRDELYETYLYDIIKKEPVESAVQRTIQNMMTWADVSQAEFNHYFLYVNLNRAVHDIKDGRISPWVVLNCSSGKEMLNKFTDEQLDIIAPALDVGYWLKKFKSLPADVMLVKEICKEAGIL
ncbi:hypothetical protein EBU71_14650 [bacterium]|nr:hypothetical protein [Candidatus Elulimicrobium humile]